MKNKTNNTPWGNLRCYLEIPFLCKWRRDREITVLPLYVGAHISWSDHSFDMCEEGGIFPKGRKVGKHLFTIGAGISYWSASITIYSQEEPT